MFWKRKRKDDLSPRSGWAVLTIFLSLFLVASMPIRAAAAAGSLDTNFNVGTKASSVSKVLLQPDGKVIITGNFTYYDYVFRQGIARLNTDASLDLSFDASNNVTGGNGINATYLYPDGKILVAGGFYSPTRSRIARLNNDGSLDSSFDPGAGPNGDIRCLAIQSDGKILIGGTFTSFAGQSAHSIARLNADGGLDTNFIASADNAVDALTIQPDGKIILAGWFSSVNGTPMKFLARLATDATLDAGFSASIGSPLECIALQPDGKILAGSPFTFTRLLPNGATDRGFNPGVNSGVNDVRVQNDGKILPGGSFTSVNGANRAYLARLYSDGSTDNSFNSVIDNLVDMTVIQPDGNLLICGGFGSVDGVAEYGLARLFGDDRTATPTIEVNGATFQALQNDPSITIPVLRTGDTNTTASVQYTTANIEAQAGSDYIATAGTITFNPGEVARTVTIPLLNDGGADYVQRFALILTNASGAVLGSNTNATISLFSVNAVVQIITPDITTNELAGSVSLRIVRAGTNIAASVFCRTVDGTAVAGIHYSNFAQTVSFAVGQATSTVSIVLLDNTLPGPDTSFSVVLTNAVSTQIGARSNLTVTIIDNDAPGHPALGVNGLVNTLAVTPDGSVALGGNFISINGIPRNRIARVHADESVDLTFDAGSGPGGFNALLAEPNGKLVCAGVFGSSGTPSYRLLFRLNPDGSLDPTFDPGSGPNSTVLSLAPSTNGAYFIVGAFTSYRGVSRGGIAKINPDGSLNNNFVSQVSVSALCRCIVPQPDGNVLVASDELSPNTNLCFRLKPDGSRDPTFTNRFSNLGIVRIYSVVLQPDGKVVAGGSFFSVNSVARNNIARLNANGSLDTTFNPGTGANSTVSKILLLNNGQMIVVGDFTSYAGVARGRIARINANGTIDSSFNPLGGADSSVWDVVPLPGNRLAITGSFLHFGGFPRHYFAILNSSGALVTRVNIESFAVSGHLQFGAQIEPDVPFEIQASSNLTDWQSTYTNTSHLPFMNFALPLPLAAPDHQFFRIVQP